LEIDQLLIEFAQPGLNFLEIVGETLDLCGHGVQARAGIGGDVLHGFCRALMVPLSLPTGVAGRSTSVFMTVWSGSSGWRDLFDPEEGSDVALELDEFASYGFRRARAHEAAARALAITAALKMAMLRTRMENPPGVRAVVRPESPTLAVPDTG